MKENNVFFLLLVFVNNCFSSFGDIRCFCNLAMCVRNGYMCKSTGPNASCFFEQLTAGSGPETARHGCVEHLNKQRHEFCEQQVRNRKELEIDVDRDEPPSSVIVDQREYRGHTRIAHRYPKMYCCVDDMCNYVSNYEMTVNVETKNSTSQHGAYISGNSSIPGFYNNISDLWWFRFAVIVVPIAGSIVLVLLILIAAKVLRQEQRTRTTLMFDKEALR